MNLTQRYKTLRTTPRRIYINYIHLNQDPVNPFNSLLKIYYGDKVICRMIALDSLRRYPPSFIDTVEQLSREIERHSYRETGRLDFVDHTSLARELQTLLNHFNPPPTATLLRDQYNQERIASHESYAAIQHPSSISSGNRY